MAAHLYWRVHITANNGSATWTSIGQIEMASEPSGTNLCTGGTIIFDEESGSYPASQAFGGNLTNLWSNSTALPHWIGYQFAAPVDVKELRMWAPINSECPQNYTIDYSDDGVTWTIAESYNQYLATNASVARTHIIYDRVPYSGSHLHWRILMESNNGHANYIAASELEMSNDGGATLCTGGTATASSLLNASYGADKAFDGLNEVSNAWISLGGEVTDQWLAYEFTAPVDIDVVKISGANASIAGANSDINTFRVEYSDDGLVWESKWRVTAQESWDDYETRIFVVPWIDTTQETTPLSHQWLKLKATPDALPYTSVIDKTWADGKWTTGGEGVFLTPGFGDFEVIYLGKTYSLSVNGAWGDGVVTNISFIADDGVVFDIRYGWFVTGAFMVEVIPSSTTVYFQVKCSGTVGHGTTTTHALTKSIESVVTSPRIDNIPTYIHCSFTADKTIDLFTGSDPQVCLTVIPMHNENWTSNTNDYSFNQLTAVDALTGTDSIYLLSEPVKAGATIVLQWTNDVSATSSAMTKWVFDNLTIDAVSRYVITGQTVQGNNVPCERTLFLHNQLNGQIVGSGKSNKQTGEFTLISQDGAPSFLRVVDESGEYNTEVVDNITPTVYVPI